MGSQTDRQADTVNIFAYMAIPLEYPPHVDFLQVFQVSFCVCVCAFILVG